jgi:hypothetical protein
MPQIGFRAGLDLNPIDLHDPDAALWPRALIWPEQLDRATLLEGAIEVARQHPLRLVTGDALEQLPAVLASVPEAAALCIYHTFVLNQFPRAARERFGELVAAHAKERDLDLIAIEWREPYPSVMLTSFEAGRRIERRLANCDPHGSWIEWLG